MNRVFNQIWDQLRGKKAQYQEFLEEVTIKNFRGINSLTVRFDYPVTVIAGPNGCGKSTALFACACVYKVPGAGEKDFLPGSIFPNLPASSGGLTDTIKQTSFQYNYIHESVRTGMIWSMINNSWKSRVFSLNIESKIRTPRIPLSARGNKELSSREVYLRKLANFTSPSEIKSVLTRNYPHTSALITSDLIAFAQRIMPNRYKQIHIISKGGKDLLFAEREEDGTKYSEFHMSAGERAILRISKDISHLKNALILIDEIEAGLHPYTQQQLMLELQRQALRNNLQIIVTTHSPVILDCVPIEGRIFFERTEENVIIKPAYRDIIQKAFYGQSLEKLSILCEDNMAEAFLGGVMDVLNLKLGFMPDDLIIGRDTGKDMFGQHIEAFGKFNLLDDFIFVLDGDAKNLENALKLKANKFNKSVQPLFLPGDVPERWAWQILTEYANEYAAVLGVSEQDLKLRLRQFDQQFDNAADKPTEKMKNKYSSFCETMHLEETDIMRKIARKEAERGRSEMKIFMNDFEMQLRNWQSRNR